MGTNYYWHPKAEDACPTCGHSDSVEPVHIGKSSAGWVFTLHVYPYGVDGLDTARINDLDDWKHIFRDRGGHIQNEYGARIPFADLEEIITDRESYRAGDRESLRRHDLGTFCISHGPGDWDLCVGEFS